MDSISKQKKENSGEHVVVGNSFISLLLILVKFRKFLIWFVLLITIGSTTFALLSQKWYKSTTSVLAAERTDFLGALSGISSLFKGISASGGLSALAGNSELDRYIAILESSSILDSVIEKFSLQQAYELQDDYYFKTVDMLKSNTEIEDQDEGDLTITVFDTDPQRAADIANYYVKLLNDLNTELSIRNAKANREFIENRYQQNVSDIDSLEKSMKNFQEKYGVIAVPEQIEASVKSMAEIYSSFTKKEIELNVLKRTFDKDNPILKEVMIEVEEIKKKINSLTIGDQVFGDNVNLLIPFKKAPELGNKYLKIYRNLEIQYKILEFITPLYEQARVEEVRNTPSVIILDKAFPAERKSKPKASLYGMLALVISLTVALIIISFLELFNRLKVENRNTYDNIFSPLKTDIKKIFFINKK